MYLEGMRGSGDGSTLLSPHTGHREMPRSQLSGTSYRPEEQYADEYADEEISSDVQEQANSTLGSHAGHVCSFKHTIGPCLYFGRIFRSLVPATNPVRIILHWALPRLDIVVLYRDPAPLKYVVFRICLHSISEYTPRARPRRPPVSLSPTQPLRNQQRKCEALGLVPALPPRNWLRLASRRAQQRLKSVRRCVGLFNIWSRAHRDIDTQGSYQPEQSYVATSSGIEEHTSFGKAIHCIPTATGECFRESGWFPVAPSVLEGAVALPFRFTLELQAYSTAKDAAKRGDFASCASVSFRRFRRRGSVPRSVASYGRRYGFYHLTLKRVD